MTLYGESSGRGGLPLVCLHGWGLNLRVFDALRAEWGDTQTLMALDLPGHGASGWDAARAGFDAQVDAVLEALPPRCALMGWSLGGQLALGVAARAPARIARLVLVATTPRFVAQTDWPHGMVDSVMQRFAAQLAHDWHQTVEEFLQLQVRGSREATAVLAALQQALREHGQAQPAALAAGLDILRDVDLRAAVAGIDIPALVISGQHDRITPPGASAWLAATLPRAQSVALPRAGHAPFLSHPPDFTHALRQFLEAA
jgi:pimeloyl-[acyl-carrier protein] methyl ester esterase